MKTSIPGAILIALVSLELCHGRFKVDPKGGNPVADRPYRPEKTYWEKLFFSGIEGVVEVVQDLPRQPLDILPFPPTFDVRRLLNGPDVEHEEKLALIASQSIRTDLYQHPKRELGPT